MTQPDYIEKAMNTISLEFFGSKIHAREKLYFLEILTQVREEVIAECVRALPEEKEVLRVTTAYGVSESVLDEAIEERKIYEKNAVYNQALAQTKENIEALKKK